MMNTKKLTKFLSILLVFGFSLSAAMNGFAAQDAAGTGSAKGQVTVSAYSSPVVRLFLPDVTATWNVNGLVQKVTPCVYHSLGGKYRLTVSSAKAGSTSQFFLRNSSGGTMEYWISYRDPFGTQENLLNNTTSTQVFQAKNQSLPTGCNSTDLSLLELRIGVPLTNYASDNYQDTLVFRLDSE
jgi:hypothetical protein